MSTSPHQVSTRKYSGVRVMIPSGEPKSADGLSGLTDPGKDHSAGGESNNRSQQNVNREIDILNHCFDSLDKFMLRLNQAAEAQSVLNQRKKRGDRKSRKNENQDAGDLLTIKATPPPEEEFVGIFQKVKYSICLLDRLKSSIEQPGAPELLHHIFVPLKLMVKTNGGPTLGASVVSPAMTSGAVSLLQKHLNQEEKELWRSLGTNWTSPCSSLGKSVPPYSPVFLDGWKPQAYDSTGQLLEDPVQLQHREDAVRESKQTQSLQAQTRAENHGNNTDKADENGVPPKQVQLCSCNYDFVARNNTELSVLQGETLQVLDPSKRWWKCRNRFDQVGFVPYNILEPLPAVDVPQGDSPWFQPVSKQTDLTSRTKCYSYTPSSSNGTNPTALSPRPQSMVLPSKAMSGEDENRVRAMNDELLQRLAKQKSSVNQKVVPNSPTLNNESPPAEVKAWLTTKDLSLETIDCLGILTGSQLFSLLEEEFCAVIPDEGKKVFSLVQEQRKHLKNSHSSSK